VKTIYKFLFELLTSPLGLPIDAIWEYLILLVIGAIAFKIGWEVSPGGPFGSLIHWSVRGLSFFVMWAIAYGIIATVKWIIANPVTTLTIVTVVIAIAFGTYATIKHLKKKHHHTQVSNA
jgi:hypothetical protein